jgi:hypothetical protein
VNQEKEEKKRIKARPRKGEEWIMDRDIPLLFVGFASLRVFGFVPASCHIIYAWERRRR